MVECGDDDASAETDRAIDRSIVGRSHPPTRQASIIEYNIAMIAMSRKICQVVPVNATTHPLMMTHAHAHMHAHTHTCTHAHARTHTHAPLGNVNVATCADKALWLQRDCDFYRRSNAIGVSLQIQVIGVALLGHM